MLQNWKSYAWLMLIALCASAIRWPDIVRDKDGKFRWGMLLLQLPVAFATGVVAHALVPAALHWFPYAGDFVGEGLAGVLAFAGPLAVVRVFDALSNRLGGTR